MKRVPTIAIVAIAIAAMACQSKKTGGKGEGKGKAKPTTTAKRTDAAGIPGHMGSLHGGVKPVRKLPRRLPFPTFVANPARSKEARAAVTLDVDAKSWRGKPPYAVASELTKRLRHAGVDVTTDKTRAWATVTIRYEESRGPKLTGQPRRGETDTHATTIRLDVKVTPRAGTWNKGRKPARPAKLTIRAQTGKTVVQSMYRAALDGLRMSPEYQVLPAWIGAASSHAGSRRAIARLHLKPINSSALLKSLRYKPRTDEERAYQLIAKDKFDACVKLGKAALPALAHFIGAKWGEKKDPKRLMLATDAIVKIDSDQSGETLVTLLAQSLATFQRQPRATTMRLLQAVTERPSLAALPIIGLLEQHWSPEIATAATAARKKILGKLDLRGTEGVHIATFRHDEAPKVLEVAPLLAAALKNAGVAVVEDPKKAGKIVIARNSAVAVLDVTTGVLYGPISPRSASVRGFSRSAWFRGLDSFIGCSIGKCKVPAALEALLTDPANSWVAPGLMKSAGYTPPAESDADFLKAISGDLEPLEKLGSRGGIAIDRALRHRSRFVPNLDLIRRAAASLVKMNAKDHSERLAISASALAVRLHRGTSEPGLEQTVVELINAFEKIGKAQWKHRLRDLARHHNAKVRTAALKASAVVKARVD